MHKGGGHTLHLLLTCIGAPGGYPQGVLIAPPPPLDGAGGSFPPPPPWRHANPPPPPGRTGHASYVWPADMQSCREAIVRPPYDLWASRSALKSNQIKYLNPSNAPPPPRGLRPISTGGGGGGVELRTKARRRPPRVSPRYSQPLSPMALTKPPNSSTLRRHAQGWRMVSMLNAQGRWPYPPPSIDVHRGPRWVPARSPHRPPPHTS